MGLSDAELSVYWLGAVDPDIALSVLTTEADPGVVPLLFGVLHALGKIVHFGGFHSQKVAASALAALAGLVEASVVGEVLDHLGAICRELG